MISIPTQEEMENFFDLLARLRTDAKLLNSLIQNRWCIVPPDEATCPSWSICRGYDAENGVPLDEIAAHRDLRTALRAAQLVAERNNEDKKK